MRRRTFVATLPALAMAPTFARAQQGTGGGAQGADGPGQGGAPQPATAKAAADLPGHWAAGEDRFIRPDVHAGDRPVGASFASRTAVYGVNGAAGTAHPFATQAGIDILRRGGSAVDAAIAINACLGFLEPTANGIGGDIYAMIWDPKLKKVVGLAGSGASPRGLSLETVRSRAKNGALPPLGAITVSVPGTVDGWWTMHQRYGKLPWATLFEPVIAMAEAGTPVPDIIAYYIRRSLVNFARPGNGVEETANALKTWGMADGKGPQAGQVFRNPDLARTLRAIAQGGRDAFYTGEIARTIDRYFKKIGGWLRYEDLAAHRSEWIEPKQTDYRGTTVHALGANTQGIATLQMLNILEHFDLKAAGFQSALSIHLQAEAKRLAYEDRARFYGDPKFSKVPVDWLISKEYAAERAKLIRPDRILTPVYPGQAPSQGDTTYFSCADKDGMMVSLIQSNFRGMGSGLVADGLGFMFQDRGQLFSLKDGHPNIYAPGKRPFQTIIPGFATRGNDPWMSFGVMGGDMQPQGQTQIIVNRVDYGLEIQSAGDAPRWHHEGSSQSMGEDDPDLGPKGRLRLESGVPTETRKRLAAIGWQLGDPDGGFGRYECVEHRMDGDTRVYAAASEMRADGCAGVLSGVPRAGGSWLPGVGRGPVGTVDVTARGAYHQCSATGPRPSPGNRFFREAVTSTHASWVAGAHEEEVVGMAALSRIAWMATRGCMRRRARCAPMGVRWRIEGGGSRLPGGGRGPAGKANVTTRGAYHQRPATGPRPSPGSSWFKGGGVRPGERLSLVEPIGSRA